MRDGPFSCPGKGVKNMEVKRACAYGTPYCICSMVLSLMIHYPSGAMAAVQQKNDFVLASCCLPCCPSLYTKIGRP